MKPKCKNCGHPFADHRSQGGWPVPCKQNWVFEWSVTHLGEQCRCIAYEAAK